MVGKFTWIKCLTAMLMSAVLLTPLSKTAFAQGDLDMSLVWIRLADEKAVIDSDDGLSAQNNGPDWHTISCEAAEFSADGTKIISGSKFDGNMRQWDVATGNMLWDKKGNGNPNPEIEAVGYTKDGVYALFVGEDKRVYVRRVSDGVNVRELQISGQEGMDGMRVSNNGRMLATAGHGGGSSGEDAVIYIWDISDPDPQQWVKIQTLIHGNSDADVNQLDWSPDDDHLISCGHCGLVKRWNTNTWSLAKTYTGFGAPNDCDNSIKGCRISPDLKYVAGAGKNNGDGQVTVWDFATGAKVAEFWNPQASQYEAVEFTKDSKHLFIAGTHGKKGSNPPHITNLGLGYINIFRCDDFDINVTPDPMKSIYCFRQEYIHLNFDDSQLVSSHEDGTLRLWDVFETGRTQIAQESFNDDGDGVRYTTTGSSAGWGVFDGVPTLNLQETELFGYQITGYFASDDLVDSVHTMTLNPVDVTGRVDVKVSILLAAADEDKFEFDDYLKIEVDLNNTSSFQSIATFDGTTGDLSLDGAGVLSITKVFQEFQFDVPAGGTDMVVRVSAKTNGNSEEIGFDNIRVSVALDAEPSDMN